MKKKLVSTAVWRRRETALSASLSNTTLLSRRLMLELVNQDKGEKNM